MTTLSEVVMGLVLSVPSEVVDIHLFEVEVGWKGGPGWDVQLVEAMVLWVMAVCPPTHVHYPPNNSGQPWLRDLRLLSQPDSLGGRQLSPPWSKGLTTCSDGR